MVAVGPSDPVKGAKVIHFRFCHFLMQRFPSQDLNDCYNLPYLGTEIPKPEREAKKCFHINHVGKLNNTVYLLLIPYSM